MSQCYREGFQHLPSVPISTPKMKPVHKSAVSRMWSFCQWYSFFKANLSSIFCWPETLCNSSRMSLPLPFLYGVGGILPHSTLYLASGRATVLHTTTEWLNAHLSLKLSHEAPISFCQSTGNSISVITGASLSTYIVLGKGAGVLTQSKYWGRPCWLLPCWSLIS